MGQTATRQPTNWAPIEPAYIPPPQPLPRWYREDLHELIDGVPRLRAVPLPPTYTGEAYQFDARATEAKILLTPQADNPYRVLGLQPGTDLPTVKAKYRTLVLTNHPDHGGDGDTFVRINTAYKQILAIGSA